MRRTICRLMLSLTAIAAIALGRAPQTAAQDEPPDLRMLLNLDLFGRSREPAAGANPQAAPAPSMLDQIRALRAMGYLGGANQTAATVTDPPPIGSGTGPTPEPPEDQGVPQL